MSSLHVLLCLYSTFVLCYQCWSLYIRWKIILFLNVNVMPWHLLVSGFFTGSPMSSCLLILGMWLDFSLWEAFMWFFSSSAIFWNYTVALSSFKNHYVEYSVNLNNPETYPSVWGNFYYFFDNFLSSISPVFFYLELSLDVDWLSTLIL